MKAITVANYLVYVMSDAYTNLTALKINMLLYFIQGYYMNKYSTPLIDENFIAADCGPVVLSVCDAYRKYGDSPVPPGEKPDFDAIPVEAEEVMFDAVRSLGRKSASTLSEMAMTSDPPWYSVYVLDNKPGAVIPKSLLLDYFSSRTLPQPIERQYTEDDFIGWRDADGYLVLPKDWYDEDDDA